MATIPTHHRMGTPPSHPNRRHIRLRVHASLCRRAVPNPLRLHGRHPACGRPYLRLQVHLRRRHPGGRHQTLRRARTRERRCVRVRSTSREIQALHQTGRRCRRRHRRDKGRRALRQRRRYSRQRLHQACGVRGPPHDFPPFRAPHLLPDNDAFANYKLPPRQFRAKFPDGVPFTVPEGHVFAMGDNRDLSSDSRTWGTVPVSQIKGQAFMIFWSYDMLNPKKPWEIWKMIADIRFTRIGRLIRTEFDARQG